MALQDLCITAARRYFDYLTQERKGLIAIPIRNKAAVGADLWQLKVTRRLYDVDAIAIQVRGQSYGAHEGGHFAVDSYDEETGVLLIKLRREIPGFEEALDDEIQVISNLRFLVERVGKWFVANGHECCLPIQTEEQAPPSPLDLSEQQTAAYEAALKSGCCYIWGPPGTGKTRYVLASAVIARLLQGRRVAILAPTNLALDLAFSSMIEAFEGLAACGRAASADGETPGRHSFLRLGVPSRKFADAFPEVCEERGLRHRMEQIKQRALVLETVIRSRKNQDCLESIGSVLGQVERAGELLRDRNARILRRENLLQYARALEKELASVLVKLTGWITGASAQRKVRLEAIRLELGALDEGMAKTELEYADIIRTIGCQRTGSPLLDGLFEEIACLRIFDEHAVHRIENLRIRLSGIHAKTVNFVADAKAHTEAYAEWSVERVERELERILAENEDLRRRATDARLRSARVIGCTVDVFIGRFRDEAMPVDHIFLDEASYTPVIKALTLFRRNVQVTLLGDHKQLPPVCEMGDQTMLQPENHACVLWARSAVFAKQVLGNPVLPDSSLTENLEEPPAAGQFARWTLTRTYRFGQNLASLLDELVYEGIGFTSGAGEGSHVEIEVIPSARSNADRSNRNESQAVCDWIRRNGAVSVAVLSPYRNQVHELRGTIPRELREDIMTVHRSQGREWDTVILSLTDTMQQPVFTDTAEAVGRLVMNTALSRAKRRIVLVCDTQIWSGRKDANRQLISRLIRAAAL